MGCGCVRGGGVMGWMLVPVLVGLGLVFSVLVGRRGGFPGLVF